MTMLGLVIAAALAGGAPAGAGAATSANLPDWSRGRNRGSDLNIEFYKRFADCIAYRWPGLGGAVVAARPGSAEEQEAMDALGMEAGFCVFSGRVRIEHHWFRGAIAEQLLRRKGPLPKPQWLSGSETAEALRAKLRAAYSGDRPNAVDRRDLTLRVAAHCTVRDSRALVEALLRTDAGSRSERAALVALDPVLSRCIAGGDMRDLMAPSLRAYLAEALYWQRAVGGTA